VESKLGPLSTSAIYWPIVPAPGDCEDGEFGGMNDRGNRSIRRKSAPAPLCPPQIPLDQTRDWTRAAAVGSQWLTASAMARPKIMFLRYFRISFNYILTAIFPLDVLQPEIVTVSLSKLRRKKLWILPPSEPVTTLILAVSLTKDGHS
jgi:hypothetical protein